MASRRSTKKPIPKLRPRFTKAEPVTATIFQEAIHIRINGPQAAGKSRFAKALIDLLQMVDSPDGDVSVRRGARKLEALMSALVFLQKRKPYQQSGPKIVITTSNETVSLTPSEVVES